MKLASQMLLISAVVSCNTTKKESTLNEALSSDDISVACAPIKGAGRGDFEFSRICLNDKYAVAKIGTAEWSEMLFTVEREQAIVHLTPVKSQVPNWKTGKEFDIILKVKKEARELPMIEALTRSGIEVEGAGGRVWITSHPSGLELEQGALIAEKFTKASNSVPSELLATAVGGAPGEQLKDGCYVLFNPGSQDGVVCVSGMAEEGINGANVKVTVMPPNSRDISFCERTSSSVFDGKKTTLTFASGDSLVFSGSTEGKMVDTSPDGSTFSYSPAPRSFKATPWSEVRKCKNK